ncbi:hypothetical protein HY374_00760 [Candidatus Berkelbacteria bacterium]|nr:hypothetical protein [Candidatus Berkelbacteria bacterium]
MTIRILFISLIVIAIVAGAVWFAASRRSGQPQEATSPETHDQVATTYRYEDGPGNCQVNKAPVLTGDITDLSLIARIIPPAGVQERGELKTHSYLHIQGDGSVPVYAPAGGVIRWGHHVIQQDTTGAFDPTLGDEYALFIELDCRYYLFIDHFSDPTDAIRGALPAEPVESTQTEFLSPPIAVTAGELLGQTRGTNPGGIWDFGLYDRQQQNVFPSSVTNASRRDEQALCPYAHYATEQRTQYEQRFDRNYPNYTRVLELCS